MENAEVAAVATGLREVDVGGAVTPGYNPLYQQVREIMVEHLIAGRWRPGDLLPSETVLAEELKVSQGTVRKALDEMVAEHLLVRRQGRGTYVAQHDQRRSLFHFFKLVAADGVPRLPSSRVLAVKKGAANVEEAKALNLPEGQAVTRIDRVRLLDDEPAIVERVSVAEARFPGLLDVKELPNALYAFFSERFNVTIISANEVLRAVAPSREQARLLRVPPGTPCLEIRRVALAIDGSPVEFRVSVVNTAYCSYNCELK